MTGEMLDNSGCYQMAKTGIHIVMGEKSSKRCTDGVKPVRQYNVPEKMGARKGRTLYKQAENGASMQRSQKTGTHAMHA